MDEQGNHKAKGTDNVLVDHVDDFGAFRNWEREGSKSLVNSWRKRKRERRRLRRLELDLGLRSLRNPPGLLGLHSPPLFLFFLLLPFLGPLQPFFLVSLLFEDSFLLFPCAHDQSG